MDVTMADLDDLRSEMQDKIDDLLTRIEELEQRV